MASKVDFLEKIDRVLAFAGFIVELGDVAGEVRSIIKSSSV